MLRSHIGHATWVCVPSLRRRHYACKEKDAGSVDSKEGTLIPDGNAGIRFIPGIYWVYTTYIAYICIRARAPDTTRVVNQSENDMMAWPSVFIGYAGLKPWSNP